MKTDELSVSPPADVDYLRPFPREKFVCCVSESCLPRSCTDLLEGGTEDRSSQNFLDHCVEKRGMKGCDFGPGGALQGHPSTLTQTITPSKTLPVDALLPHHSKSWPTFFRQSSFITTQNFCLHCLVELGESAPVQLQIDQVQNVDLTASIPEG